MNPTLRTHYLVYAFPFFLRKEADKANVVIEVERKWSDAFGNSRDVYVLETIGL